MSATSVTMTATCLDGKPLEALERLIAQRQRELGETTSEAVIATAINALSSIRAITKVVNVKKASGFVTVAPYPGLIPSVRTLGKGKDAKRIPCLRYGPRGHHADVTYYNIAPKNFPMKDCKCFIVQDRKSADMRNQNTSRFFIIARNLDEAKAYAGKRRIRRIERHAGLAKWTIGQAQSQVSQKGAIGESVAAAVKQIGIRELQVAVYERGWGEGNVSVSVADNLKYAALALKGGPGEVNTALMRAANRTAGIINAHYKMLHPFEDERAIPTPFPEVPRRK